MWSRSGPRQPRTPARWHPCVPILHLWCDVPSQRLVQNSPALPVIMWGTQHQINKEPLRPFSSLSTSSRILEICWYRSFGSDGLCSNSSLTTNDNIRNMILGHEKHTPQRYISLRLLSLLMHIWNWHHYDVVCQFKGGLGWSPVKWHRLFTPKVVIPGVTECLERRNSTTRQRAHSERASCRLCATPWS